MEVHREFTNQKLGVMELTRHHSDGMGQPLELINLY